MISKIRSFSNRTRLGIILGIGAIFGLVEMVLASRLGDSTAIVTVIPVGIAAVAYGWRGGLAAGVAGAVFNGVALTSQDYPATSTTFVIGNVAEIVIGVVIGIFVDIQLRAEREIALRQQSQEALQLSEKQYRLLADNALDLIITVASGGRIVYASPAMQDLVGYDHRFMVGQSIYDIIDPQDADGVRKLGSEMRREFSGTVVRFRLRHRSGEVLWAETAIRPIRDTQDGEGVHYVAVVRDISRQKALEEQLERANEDLEVSINRLAKTPELLRDNRLAYLGQMASGIAHDFNNALTPILGFSDLLLQRPHLVQNPEVAKKYVGFIRTAAGDAADVAGRLREYYRLDLAQAPLVGTDLYQMVQDAVTLTRPKWETLTQTEDSSIEDLIDLAPDLPLAAAPQSEIREVLTNLIFNAVDAMPSGGTITLRGRVFDGIIRLEVQDTGIGMTDEVLKRCLEVFYTTKGSSGTGMGLAVVKAIVEEFGGDIRIESAIGEGSNFIINFPRFVESEAAEGPPVESQPEAIKRRLSVLVVDNDGMSRAFLASALTSSGHSVELAKEGLHAIQRSEAGTFDLVIADQVMPDMSGSQLSFRLKELLPSTPIIMLSGLARFMEDAGSVPTAVDLLLAKPVTVRDLEGAIASVLSREIV